jgi:hypothetical protein
LSVFGGKWTGRWESWCGDSSKEEGGREGASERATEIVLEFFFFKKNFWSTEPTTIGRYPPDLRIDFGRRGFASHLAVCWTGRKRVEGPGVGLLGTVRVRRVRMRV